MNYLLAIVYGVVQGLTEFFPVSSSGHLLLLHQFLPLPTANELAFDTILHFATLIALVAVFWQDVLELIAGWFKSLKGEKNESGSLAWMILLATIPAGLAGALLNDWIDINLRSPLLVALMLAIVAGFFFWVEAKAKQDQEIKDVKYPKAVFIGFAQALALIPGTSRSGITIVAGMTGGLTRKAAAKFSFLLSMPIIAAAAIKQAPKLLNSSMSRSDLILLSFAFVSAMVASFWAIKFFLKLTEKTSLKVFAWYRLLLAFIIVVLLGI